MKTNHHLARLIVLALIVPSFYLFIGCGGGGGDGDDDVVENVATKEWFLDSDNDGYGDANSPMKAAQKPSGYVSNARDCDDGNADKYPGNSDEICGDDVDHDCDGKDCDLSLYKEMLDSFNEYRASGFFCNDDETDNPPVHPLTWNEKLFNAVQEHSIDMAENEFLEHNGSDGSTAGERIEDAGYQYINYLHSIKEYLELPFEPVDYWMDSSACQYIMSDDYVDMGLAQKNGYWALLLASPCTLEQQNKFVYEYMMDNYLWYDKMPEVDYTEYESPEDLLDALMYKELDKWSYITDKEDYYALFEEGKYIGVGYGSKYDENEDLRVRFVYKDSPADKAGMKRGDILLQINGKPISEISENDLWDDIMGEDKVGVVVNMSFENAEGVVNDVELTKEWVTMNTVLHYEILQHYEPLEQKEINIGYLVFNSFLETSREELDAAFKDFHNRVDELIVDLRYNGGGRVDIAQHLASLIGGDKVKGEIFEKIIHNDKNQSDDYEYYFIDPEYALTMDRVFFITTKSTASASESVINSLTPFLDVIKIGEETSGKPVGMSGRDFCDKRIVPITFKGANAKDVGDYYDGIPPTCHSEDDLTRDFGDTDETMLNNALYYIANDSCLEAGDLIRRHVSEIDIMNEKIRLKGFRGEINAY